tara:strand:+ start:187 stop:450 length:264 start_codon:yes stop_codon:yes gene_type:complete
MSVSNKNLIEIDMINQIIKSSTYGDETKKNLLDILEKIISVADKIDEWGDYMNDEFLLEYSDTSSEEEESDGDYLPEVSVVKSLSFE